MPSTDRPAHGDRAAGRISALDFRERLDYVLANLHTGVVMTPRQIALVQASFARLEPRLHLFTETFYAQLFETHPLTKLLFRGDPDRQADDLGVMLSTAVMGLSRVEEIKPALRGLGLRHVGYGVRNGDYRNFGEALLWTLERFLGDGYTPEVADAWQAFYDFVTGIMQGRIDWHIAPLSITADAATVRRR